MSSAGATRQAPENLILHGKRSVSQDEGSNIVLDDTSRNFPTSRDDSNNALYTADTDNAINSSDTKISTRVHSQSLREFDINHSGGVHIGAPTENYTLPLGSASPTSRLAISPQTDRIERFLRISPHDPWAPQNLRFQLNQFTSSHEHPYSLLRFLQQPADDPWTSVFLGNHRDHVQDVVDNVDRLGLNSHLYIERTEEIPWRSIAAVLLE